jgi:predicted Holliday junction resolvase-like endonuclease
MLALIVVLLVMVLIVVLTQYNRLLKSLSAREREINIAADNRLTASLEAFRKVELAEAKRQAYDQASLEFERFKTDYTCTERADAVKKSRAVNRGLVSEQLAPHLAGFAYNPKDAHFLGQPVDYVIFSGLDSGLLKEIVLLDVKTGEAKLNARQVQIKNIVSEKKIRFETFRPETN